jgi:glycosyltransferase involved in cell wall biosynthesis
MKKMIEGDERFKLIKNSKNFGIAKTSIIGIENSTASIFARLDPDDALKNNAIELSIKTHDEFPMVGLVYSNFVFCDDNLQEKNIHKTKQIHDLNEDYYGFRGEISHFATFKKEFYFKTTGYDSFLRIAEDKDIYMKMCEVAPVKHIDEVCYKYRVHTGGISNFENVEKAIFWHWVAMIKMSERRGINLEELFVENYLPRNNYQDLEKKFETIRNNYQDLEKKFETIRNSYQELEMKFETINKSWLFKKLYSKGIFDKF